MTGYVQLFCRCTVNVLGRKAEFGFCPLLVFSTCILLFVVTDFRHEADETGALLRHYAFYSGNSLPPFRDNLSVSSSRVKIQEDRQLLFLHFLTLEDGTDRVPRNGGKELPLYAGNVVEERKSVFNRLRHRYKHLPLI